MRFSLLFLFAAALFGQTATFSDIAISPDGTRLAWLQGVEGSTAKTLHITRAGKDTAVPVPGAKDLSSPAWSSDGRTLTVVASNAAGDPELALVNGDTNTVKVLARLKGFADRPKFSPDGKRIAFLYVEGASGGGPLAATGVQTGVIDTGFHNQRIGMVDVATGKQGFGSAPDRHVYDFDWSPDGRQLVATAAPGPGDNNWWIAELYVFDSGTGAGKSIYKPKLQLATPRYSPDGKIIAFIEGLMSDEGFHGGEVFTVPAGGGAAVNRTPGRKSSPNSVAWQGPEQLLFTERMGGGSGISVTNTKTGVTETLWRGDEDAHIAGNFPNLALSKDGRTAGFIRSTFGLPPAVWGGLIGEWKPVTHANDAVKPKWGGAQSLEFTVDGAQVQAWLIPPAKPAAGKNPLIVQIHGGPSNSVVPVWPDKDSNIALLTGKGYYVLLPNPRGSYGQGEVFTQANVKDFGYGDLKDILGAVDAAIAKFPIDPERLGVTGWSYGGYMTMFAVTQTNRFKAAVAGAGIANWQSYYGQNLIDQWMIPFFGASVYDDPAVYAKSSPITFIKNVKTPTLVVVGEQDAECPAPQSYEFWHALKTFQVPTQLVVYPGEGHQFMQPKNKEDRAQKVTDWFGKYLK